MLKELIKQVFKSKAARDRESLALARDLIQISDLSHAMQVIDGLVATSPDCGPAWRLRARLNQRMGKVTEAGADLARAALLTPDDAESQFEIAASYLELGNTSEALKHCKTARQLAPDDTRVFAMLARISLPGDFYFDVLGRIIEFLKPKTYVEIGIFRGESLKLARAASAVVGIDPQPQIDWAPEPHIRIFATTSDAFFANHDLRKELGGRPVDLAFIDGLHQFEFALRDFANLERNCKPESTILVHDCYPVDEISADREPRSVSWSGDVWRLIVLLKKYRPDLLIHTIATGPTGLTIIKNLDPVSTFLHDNLAKLYQEFLALDYAYLDQGKEEKLNLRPNNWPEIRALLNSQSA